MGTDLRLKLWGTFSATLADGTDATPHLLKCQAILAMLALSSDGRRTRSWMQARLWSDRSREQANGSLRQALAVLRKALGPARDCLTADRKVIGLDMSRVTVTPRNEGEEFLAGFDLPDEGFNDWLRNKRGTDDGRNAKGLVSGALLNAPLGQPAPAEDPPIVLTGSGTTEARLGPVETFLIDATARALREGYGLRVHIIDRPDREGRPINVALSARRSENSALFLRAQCTDRASSELIWSGHQSVAFTQSSLFDDLDVLAWVNDLVAAIAEHLRRRALRSRDQQSATMLGLTALRDLFSMRPERVEAADRLLVQAHEIDSRGVFLAWRAKLKAIQRVERHRTDGDALREEGFQLMNDALRFEPMNASVLGASAIAHLILDPDLIACDELSRQGWQANRANPVAALSRAFVLLYADRLPEAMVASDWALAMSRGSPHRFFWDLQVAMAACASGDLDRAITTAERCAVFGPDCRPPMRYLVGLYAARGDHGRALHWARKLKALEPDFEPARLVADPAYPSSLLRRHKRVTHDALKPVAERLAP